MGEQVDPRSDYVCPGCGSPLIESGETREPKNSWGPRRLVLVCQRCGTTVEGPPSRHAMAAGWRTVTLVAVVGLTMVGLSFAVPDSTVLIGLSSVLPHGLPLLLRVLGVCLCVLAAFALRDLLHGRQSVRYWQQHRRAH